MRRLPSFVSALLMAAGFCSGPAVAEDWPVCAETKGEAAIAACNRLIASGREHGRNLATTYYNRGNAWLNKKDFDRAIADL
jgi:hypothetical protein